MAEVARIPEVLPVLGDARICVDDLTSDSRSTKLVDMRFHLATKSGRWVGGFQCRRDNLSEQLDELRDIAQLWSEPLVATRLDRRRSRNQAETYEILPRLTSLRRLKEDSRMEDVMTENDTRTGRYCVDCGCALTVEEAATVDAIRAELGLSAESLPDQCADDLDASEPS